MQFHEPCFLAHLVQKNVFLTLYLSVVTLSYVSILIMGKMERVSQKTGFMKLHIGLVVLVSSENYVGPH
jgi:hypothetical protein